MTTVAGTASTDARRFEIGGVIAASLKLYARHFAVLTLLMVALYWLPSLGINQAAPWLLHHFARPDYTEWLRLARAIIDALITQTLAVCVALLVLGPGLSFRDASVRTFGQAAEMFPRIVLIALILGAGQIVGALFVLPTPKGSAGAAVLENSLWVFGLAITETFITLAFGIAAPVLAVERPGVLATLGRAFRLMSGHRGSFFGLLVISGVAFTLVGLAELPLLGSALKTNPIAQGIRLFVAGQLQVVWGVIVATSYRELIRIKEGWRPVDVADVFD